MSCDEDQQPALEQSSRHAGDRFSRRGRDLILKAALAAIEKHRSLPAGQVENFASKFAKGTGRLNIQQDERTASLALLPLTLLKLLVEPSLWHFPSSRKRAMTGLEAAEEEESQRRRQRRAVAVAEQAESARDEHEER
jgi:hypothetical protein